MAKNFKAQANKFLQDINAEQETPAEAAEPIKTYANPLYIEVKSKRVQLVFKPTTHAKAKAKADSLGISLNEYLHRLIDADN